MISSQPAIPLLVHEDCMEGVHLDLAKQQASLSNIENIIKTDLPKQQESLSNIESNTRVAVLPLDNIEMNTSAIKASSSNTATATSSLYSSVGTTADADTATTVIGLLKSIANKL